jgi:hypothetical protein
MPIRIIKTDAVQENRAGSVPLVRKMRPNGKRNRSNPKEAV